VSLEGIEPSPHGVRIRHAANKHLKLEQVVAAGFEPAPHRLKAGPLPIELRHLTRAQTVKPHQARSGSDEPLGVRNPLNSFQRGGEARASPEIVGS
jgi:hypothetical protein